MKYKKQKYIEYLTKIKLNNNKIKNLKNVPMHKLLN